MARNHEIKNVFKTEQDVFRDACDLEVLKVTPGSTFKILNKKDFFIVSGKAQKAMGLVVKGLARGYIIDQDGNEMTIGFFSEGDYATDYSNSSMISVLTGFRFFINEHSEIMEQYPDCPGRC